MLSASLALVLAAAAPLKWDWRIDVPVTAGLTTTWLLTEYGFKKQLAPAECRWCAHNPLDDAARGIRLPVERQQLAATASDVIGVVATPLTVIGLDWLLAWQSDASWKDGAVDALVILEAMTLSQVLNQVVKFSVARERPFVAALPAAEKSQTSHPEDNNLSFFSGHSSYTFALVTAAATVAKLRGYTKWWVILAAGLPLAATTAILRMVADKHYLTDVWMGSSFGMLIGFVVPWFFHQPLEAGPVEVSLSAGPGGVSVLGRW